MSLTDDDAGASPMESQCIECPYCGEQLEVAVDWSIRRQQYVEDCQVCCRPMTLTVVIDDDQQAVIDVRTEAD